MKRLGALLLGLLAVLSGLLVALVAGFLLVLLLIDNFG